MNQDFFKFLDLGGSVLAVDPSDEHLAIQILRLMVLGQAAEAQVYGQAMPEYEEEISALQASDQIFWGFFRRDALLGVISYDGDGRHCELRRLAVHPAVMGQGIGQQLMQRVHETCGAQRVGVEVASFNAPALGLYHKMGYEKEAETPLIEEVVLYHYLKYLR